MARITFSEEWYKLAMAGRFYSHDEYKFHTLRPYTPYNMVYYNKMRKSREMVDIVLKGRVVCKAIVLDVFIKDHVDIDDFEVRMDTYRTWNKPQFEDWVIGTYGKLPEKWIKIYLMKDGSHDA